ncbi:calmodulin-binding protein 25-like [Curcuma longa]|uniref:calmodulin-binding protein 25-like n=1 Tax=Curcuma longa TaxID=136217 RepID=UPI003D9E6841
MADNCSVLDPWVFRSEPAWMREAFARDNEALTRALQISLSDTSSSGAASPSVATSSSPSLLQQQHHHHLAPSAAPLRPRNHPLGPASAARVAKRKSRASKRSPTTYINTDPSNFREMVQRVTGVQLIGDLPPDVEPLVKKPEPIRPSPAPRAASPQQAFLPTLDTSALLLANGVGPFAASPELPVFDADALFPAFPTLESWGVM